MFYVSFSLPESGDPLPSMHTAYQYLDLVRQQKHIRFVYGRGCRKTPIQRFMETLESFILRQTKYNGYNKTFNGRNSFSKTDPGATFMRMSA